MHQKTLKILSLLIILTNCKPNIDKLKGHWHSVDLQENMNYQTMDIYDSIVILNEHSITGFYKETFSVYFESTEIELPQIRNYISTQDFRLKSDTLIIGNFKERYVRHDLTECILSDYFSDLMVIVAPEICTRETLTYDSLVKKYKPAHVSMGKPIGIYSKNYSDSAFLQVNDVYINLNDIEYYILHEKSLLEGRESIVFCLHIDKSINKKPLVSAFRKYEKKRHGSFSFRHLVVTTCFNLKNKEIEFQTVDLKNVQN